MIHTAVAEDDFRIASIHQELVERVDGFQCSHQALNAKETMEILDQHPVDLLLLDIFMPDELGTNLFSRIRENFPDIDIIIISASSSTTHVQKSLRYGVFDYIVKPVSLERLEQTLQNYLAFRGLLSEDGEMTQSHIDQLTFHQPPDPPLEQVEVNSEEQLPKGIDPLTLQSVRKKMNEMKEGVTAEEMGTFLGASRTTARRYLEYLISADEAEAKPIYGIVGRPERKYFQK
ncbi:response regulator [Salibacterium qingdaonense]|uniref:Two-component system, CitB family, response regulator CitT n=1 Tax=Salibacterium qingdaonense TaxID=266892 RepID=A0A1I4MBT1_9BACI|nr:response regulator [Salibacterium qingdaonense]SFM00493.1 two-component system, CitB family, response regulator CitT [Salibacterium qingdaonense]